MQIHEITLLQEGLGDIAKTIGSDIKSAVKAPFQKAKAVLDTPGSLTSARGYQAAKDKYYQGLVGQRQETDLAAWARNLAGEWLKQPRPSSQTPIAGPAPTTKPAATTQPVPTTPQAATTTPVKTAGVGPAYKNVTYNVPTGVPNPTAATGLPQPTTGVKPTVAPATPVAPAPATKKRTGGKKPGVLSQTPGAIQKRAARAKATATPPVNSIARMAQTLDPANKTKSSTGGTTTLMPTGRFHAANLNNPNIKPPVAAAPDTTAAKPAPKWLTPTTKISKASAGKPTADEYAKLQQRIAAADAKQRGVTNEAFADLPGAKPTAGGAVSATATAKPKGIKAPPPLQSRYAQNFKSWVASKVATNSSKTGISLGLADVEKMPGMSRGLNQALVKVVQTQQDPKANQMAVEQYLLMIGQAMQKLSAEQKATLQKQGTRNQPSALTPLSSVLNTRQIDSLKTMAQDPRTAAEIKMALGLR